MSSRSGWSTMTPCISKWTKIQTIKARSRCGSRSSDPRGRSNSCVQKKMRVRSLLWHQGFHSNIRRPPEIFFKPKIPAVIFSRDHVQQGEKAGRHEGLPLQMRATCCIFCNNCITRLCLRCSPGADAPWRIRADQAVYATSSAYAGRVHDAACASLPGFAKAAHRH